MTLEELTAAVERGLEKWPDGVTARCVLNGEAYQTLALAYTMNGTAKDGHVIEGMAQLIEQIKAERSAKFISWRKPFEWHEQTLTTESIIAGDPLGADTFEYAPTVNGCKRMLRCRVLITAKTGDCDWPSKPL